MSPKSILFDNMILHKLPFFPTDVVFRLFFNVNAINEYVKDMMISGTTKRTISRNRVNISNPSSEGHDSLHLYLPAIVYIE
jgi:hypothetical protein